MLLPFLLAAFASGQWIILLFMSLHIGAGLAMMYWTLALLLNSTEVKVDRNQLTIQHGPLPGKQNLTASARDIIQIYCKEKVTYGKRSSSVKYEVYALSRNQTRQQLITDLPSAEDAVFLEQEIERFLKIQDRPIQGELLP
ncbi:MAG: hypothetical protein F6K28_38980 [Microcoleus sp. SIO2G3]|nr:hypothetical protein [Microcoleus sp. SIO2G3]